MTVASLGLLGLIGGASYVLATPAEYTAESDLFVAAVGADSTNDLAQGSNFSQQQARNYSAIAERDIVLAPIIRGLGLETTTSELADRVSATVPLNTSLISISVRDTSPERAAATADAVAASLATIVTEITPKRSDGSSPINLEVVQEASIPEAPSAPSVTIALALGAIGGLLLGAALVVLSELVNAKVRSVDHLKELTGLTVLGSVSDDRSVSTRHVYSHDSRQSIRAEEFRQIRTNLRFLIPDDEHKVFVFTSSIPSEGKSMTSAALAVALAASGTSTCLIEADLRKPSLARYLGLEGGVGLTSILAGDASLDDATQTWGPDNLKVLLSGPIPPNPSELLESEQAHKLFTTIRRMYDVVIVDCPPLMPVTDGAIVARMFGGAIMVVGIGKVEVNELNASIESLTTSGAPVLGVIANFAPATIRSRYQEYSETDFSSHAKTGSDNKIGPMIRV